MVKEDLTSVYNTYREKYIIQPDHFYAAVPDIVGHPPEFPLVSRIAKGYAVLDNSQPMGVKVFSFGEDYAGVYNALEAAQKHARSVSVATMTILDFIEDNLKFIGRKAYSVDAHWYYYDNTNSLSVGFAWQKALIHLLRMYRVFPYKKLPSWVIKAQKAQERKIRKERDEAYERRKAHSIAKKKAKEKKRRKLKALAKQQAEERVAAELRFKESQVAEKARQGYAERDGFVISSKMIVDAIPQKYLEVIFDEAKRIAAFRNQHPKPPCPKKDIEGFLAWTFPSYKGLKACAKYYGGGRGPDPSNKYQRFPYIMAASSDYWTARAGMGTVEEFTNSFSVSKYKLSYDRTRRQRELRAQWVAFKWKLHQDRKIKESRLTYDHLMVVFDAVMDVVV